MPLRMRAAQTAKLIRKPSASLLIPNAVQFSRFTKSAIAQQP